MSLLQTVAGNYKQIWRELKNLVIVNGYPESGKDTFVDFCIQKLKVEGFIFSEKASSVDAIKEFAIDMGWDGIKTPESRLMLSDLKDFCTKHFDLPFKDCIGDAAMIHDQKVLFYMIREPEEIKRVVDWFKDDENVDVCTVLVLRKREDDLNLSNHADRNVINYIYDHVIMNDGTKEELSYKANKFSSIIV